MPLDPAQTLTLRVSRREPLCDDIVAFELRAADDRPLPAFEAGAHIDLHLPPARPGQAPRRRSYSLCNPPGERDRYLIAVQHEHAGRGGSAWLHAQLQPGDRIDASAPRQLFALQPAPHHLLLAGGIGLTPLLAMAETLWAQDRSFTLQVRVRSRARLPFARRLQEAPWAQAVQVLADDEAQANTETLDRLIAVQPAGTWIWTCGPAGFMAAVRAAATRAGWSADRVVSEHFAAPGAEPPAAPVAAGGFEIDWAPTGQRLAVAPHQSVAQVLQAAGIAVALSCEQGICGQCCVQHLDGPADHRDLVYGAHEHQVERRFTPCCSRAPAASRLVLAPLGWTPAA